MPVRIIKMAASMTLRFIGCALIKAYSPHFLISGLESFLKLQAADIQVRSFGSSHVTFYLVAEVPKIMKTKDAKMCRTCFTDNADMYYIYDIFDQDISLKDIFTSTTNFEVSKEDGFSSYLCNDCTSIIVNFYNLKATYEEHLVKLETKETPTEETIIITSSGTDCEILKDAKILDEHTNDDIKVVLKTQDGNNDNGQVSSSMDAYTCVECNKCFTQKKDIKEHLEKIHEISEYCNTQCGFCHKTFSTDEEYCLHLDLHNESNTCSFCGASFMKRVYLKDHLDSHRSTKKYVCEICNKAFKRRTVLAKHRKLHTNPREWVCETCGKAFNDKCSMQTHIQVLHIKECKFPCTHCTKSFHLKCTLVKHIKRAHGFKKRDFKCKLCTLSYKDKCSLDRHIYMKHSGLNTQVKCDQCSKVYTTASNLFKHKRMCHDVDNKEKII